MATTGTDLLKGLAMTLSAKDAKAERRHEKEIKMLDLAFQKQQQETNTMIQLYHEDARSAEKEARGIETELDNLIVNNQYAAYASKNLPETDQTESSSSIIREIGEPLVDYMQRRADAANVKVNDKRENYNTLVTEANKMKTIHSQALGMVDHMSDNVEGISIEDLRNSLHQAAVNEGIGQFQKEGLERIDLNEAIVFDNGYSATPDSVDFGLFQLNSHHQGSTDQQEKVWGTYVDPQEMSESQNITYAMKLASQEGWDRWAAYNNKSYEKYSKWTDEEYLNAGVSQATLNKIEAEAIANELDPKTAKAIMMAESGGDHSAYLMNFSQDKMEQGASLRSGSREFKQGRYIDGTEGLKKMADHLITNKLVEDLEVTRRQNLPFTDKTQLFKGKLDDLGESLDLNLEKTLGSFDSLVNPVLTAASTLVDVNEGIKGSYEEMNAEEKQAIDDATANVESSKLGLIAPFLSEDQRNILNAGEADANYLTVKQQAIALADNVISNYELYDASDKKNKTAIGNMISVLSGLAYQNGMSQEEIAMKLGFTSQSDVQLTLQGIVKYAEGQEQLLQMSLGQTPTDDFSFSIGTDPVDQNTVIEALTSPGDIIEELDIDPAGDDTGGGEGLDFDSQEDPFADTAFKFTPGGEEFDPSFLSSGEQWSYTPEGEKTDENYIVKFGEDTKRLYTPSKITKVEALNELNSLLDQGGFTMASLMKELNELSFSDKRKFLNQYADQVGIDPGEGKRTLKAWDQLGSGAVGRTLGFMNRANFNESITNIESLKDFEATKDLIITFAKLKGVDISPPVVDDAGESIIQEEFIPTSPMSQSDSDAATIAYSGDGAPIPMAADVNESIIENIEIFQVANQFAPGEGNNSSAIKNTGNFIESIGRQEITGDELEMFEKRLKENIPPEEIRVMIDNLHKNLTEKVMSDTLDSVDQSFIDTININPNLVTPAEFQQRMLTSRFNLGIIGRYIYDKYQEKKNSEVYNPEDWKNLTPFDELMLDLQAGEIK